MANYCSNTVAFQGSATAITQVQKAFIAMKEKQASTNKGQVPDFVTHDDGYFIDIYWNEGDSGIFQYETRWAPNTQVVKAIADHYGLGFTLEYAEMGSLVYGKMTYCNGVLTDTCLDWDDFDRYYYNEERDVYCFEQEE